MSLINTIPIFFKRTIFVIWHFWIRNKIFQHFQSEFDKHSDNTNKAESEVLQFSVDKLEVDFDADLLEEDGHRRLPAQAEHLPRVGNLELRWSKIQ